MSLSPKASLCICPLLDQLSNAANQDGVVNSLGFFIWIGVCETECNARGLRVQDAERDVIDTEKDAALGSLPLSTEVRMHALSF